MSARPFPVHCDFCETSLDDVALLIGVPIPDLTVWVGRANRRDAQRLQGIYGFSLVVVPGELLKNNGDAWGAQAGTEFVWSEGA